MERECLSCGGPIIRNPRRSRAEFAKAKYCSRECRDTGRPGFNARLFESRYEETGGCWIWNGQIDRHGYGVYNHQGAHRVSYEHHVGPIPPGMTIDHVCFNPPCVNPAHLRPMSNEDNARRQRSTLAETCINGHPWTPENTYYRPGSTEGRRACRACNRIQTAKYLAKRRAAA